MKLFLAALLAAVCSLYCTAQNKGIRILFQPDSDQFFLRQPTNTRPFGLARGQAITAAMEAIAGLKFEDREVKAMVLEVSSDSGYKETPKHLRASYPADTNKATLIHELGQEKQRGRMYPSAWEFALSFTPEQRAAKWKEIVAERVPR